MPDITINGNTYDWADVTIQLPNGEAIGVTEIAYNDEQPGEARYGKGSTPQGFGRGNYKAGGSMSMDRAEAERLRSGLGDKLFKAVFDIVVSYGDDGDDIVTDTLSGVRIAKQDTSAKQGDKITGNVKFDLEIYEPILWDGKASI